MSQTYYVYSLKDPRKKPAVAFYVGKGTGSRATDHLKKPDETRKGRLIQEILADGLIPIVTIVIDKLTEEQAYQIELALITMFGTVDTGGLLYNSVTPRTIKRRIDKNIIIPTGAIEKAQLGLTLLKESILSLAEENPTGITNSDCAHYLSLQSSHDGNQEDYLTYSLLGLLKKDGALVDKKIKNRRKYFSASAVNKQISRKS